MLVVDYGCSLKFASSSLIPGNTGEKYLILRVGRGIELRKKPANVSLILLQQVLLEERRRQILILINEGEIYLGRGECVPIRVHLPAPEASRVQHLVLAHLVDEDFLVRFEREDLRHEISLAHGVEKRVQIQLFVQAGVRIVKELLSVLALLIALHALEAAAASAQHPYPPGLPVRVVELGLGSEGLLQDEIRLVFCVADLAVGALRGAKIYRPYE